MWAWQVPAYHPPATPPPATWSWTRYPRPSGVLCGHGVRRRRRRQARRGARRGPPSPRRRCATHPPTPTHSRHHTWSTRPGGADRGLCTAGTVREGRSLPAVLPRPVSSARRVGCPWGSPCPIPAPGRRHRGECRTQAGRPRHAGGGVRGRQPGLPFAPCGNPARRHPWSPVRRRGWDGPGRGGAVRPARWCRAMVRRRSRRARGRGGAAGPGPRPGCRGGAKPAWPVGRPPR
jgi:hypothetical protein